LKEADFTSSKMPVVPDPETVRPPLAPTVPAPVPIPMPHPEQVKPGDQEKKTKEGSLWPLRIGRLSVFQKKRLGESWG
jgi:hypothetical protein